MASIGHRTGLFDVLRELPPATSEEIATRAGLNERYVREWLRATVTTGVIDVHPVANRVLLLAEHAAFLTRAAVADNMAVLAHHIAVLGGVDDIVVCFARGGSGPYEKYLLFHEVMAEDSRQSVLSSLESHILPPVPAVTNQLVRGICVLNVGWVVAPSSPSSRTLAAESCHRHGFVSGGDCVRAPGGVEPWHGKHKTPGLLPLISATLTRPQNLKRSTASRRSMLSMIKPGHSGCSKESIARLNQTGST
jgi:hypothetical protein